MKFCRDWKAVNKHISTQCMGIFLVFTGLWSLLPEAFQNAFSPIELKCAAYALIAIGFIGKYVDQGLDAHDNTGQTNHD